MYKFWLTRSERVLIEKKLVEERNAEIARRLPRAIEGLLLHGNSGCCGPQHDTMIAEMWDSFRKAEPGSDLHKLKHVLTKCENGVPNFMRNIKEYDYPD